MKLALTIVIFVLGCVIAGSGTVAIFRRATPDAMLASASLQFTPLPSDESTIGLPSTDQQTSAAQSVVAKNPDGTLDPAHIELLQAQNDRMYRALQLAKSRIDERDRKIVDLTSKVEKAEAELQVARNRSNTEVVTAAGKSGTKSKKTYSQVALAARAFGSATAASPSPNMLGMAKRIEPAPAQVASITPPPAAQVIDKTKAELAEQLRVDQQNLTEKYTLLMEQVAARSKPQPPSTSMVPMDFAQAPNATPNQPPARGPFGVRVPAPPGSAQVSIPGPKANSRSIPGSSMVPAMDLRSDVPIAVVIAEKANLRSGPGNENAPVITVSEGTRLTIEKQEGDWLQVTTPTGSSAFIRADMVRIGGNPAVQRKPKKPAARVTDYENLTEGLVPADDPFGKPVANSQALIESTKIKPPTGVLKPEGSDTAGAFEEKKTTKGGVDDSLAYEAIRMLSQSAAPKPE